MMTDEEMGDSTTNVNPAAMSWISTFMVSIFNPSGFVKKLFTFWTLTYEDFG